MEFSCKKQTFINLLLLIFFLPISISTAASDELLDWVKKNKLTTTHASKVYHWATREKPGISFTLQRNIEEKFGAPRIDLKGESTEKGPLELTPPEAKEYFQFLTTSFYEKPAPDWTIGNGFYTAFDPLQSIELQGNPWVLLELTLPAGLNYIDVDVLHAPLELSDDYLKANMSNKGFPDKLKASNKVRAITLVSDSKLRIKFLEALKTEQISIIRYQWKAVAYTKCDAKKWAFNIINPQLLDQGASIITYAKDHPTDPNTSASYDRLKMKIKGILDNSAPVRADLRNRIPLFLRSKADEPALSVQDLNAESFECGNT